MYVAYRFFELMADTESKLGKRLGRDQDKIYKVFISVVELTRETWKAWANTFCEEKQRMMGDNIKISVTQSLFLLVRRLGMPRRRRGPVRVPTMRKATMSWIT